MARTPLPEGGGEGTVATPTLEFEEIVEESGANVEQVPGNAAVPGFLEEAGGEEEEERQPVGEPGVVQVDPDELEGLFLYGSSAEMGTPLTQVGNTVAGIITQVVRLELDADSLVIRAFDVQSGDVIDGGQGVIESYPLEWTDEGQVRILFEEPMDTLEIQLYQSCTYGLTATRCCKTLYGRMECSPGGFGNVRIFHVLAVGFDDSTGLNIHFLRRFGANPDYIPKEKEDGAPFGFFQVDSLSGGKQVITRLPGATLDAGDGQVKYYFTENFPKKFRAAAKGVFQDWNDVFEEEVESGLSSWTMHLPR